MSVGEDPRPGRPSTLTNADHVERGHAVICGNRPLSVQEVADEVSISIGFFHQILTEKLQMRRVSAKFVPRLLTDVQKSSQWMGKGSPRPKKVRMSRSKIRVLLVVFFD